MIGLQINVRDKATPALQRAVDALRDRRPLNLLVGAKAQELIRNHLIGLAQSRHKTAERLGAQPSGFLAQAAEKVGRAEAVKEKNDGVAISLNHPGLRRAFEDVTITPGAGKKALTIPLIAQAYNQRAYRVEGLFIPKKGDHEKSNVLLKKNEDGSVTAWYLLVPKVVQKQDRTLLPSDQEITETALGAVRQYISAELKAAGL